MSLLNMKRFKKSLKFNFEFIQKKKCNDYVTKFIQLVYISNLTSNSTPKISNIASNLENLQK